MKKTVIAPLGVLLVLAFVLAILPTTLDELHWRRASHKDMAVSYESYMKAWPDGRHAAEAQARYDERDWINAEATNTLQEFVRYVQLHGDGKHVAEAKDTIESLHWQEAATANTIRSYRNYTSAHPHGKFVQEAEINISTLLTDDSPFDAALKARTKVALKQFIKDFPGHQKEQDARQAYDTIVGRAIVDLEYPTTVDSTQREFSNNSPVWNFSIVFRERNGVSARINCVSLCGSTLKKHWWNPSPTKGNIRLQANG